MVMNDCDLCNSRFAAGGRVQIPCLLPLFLTEGVEPASFFLFSRDMTLTVKSDLKPNKPNQPSILNVSFYCIAHVYSPCFPLNAYCGGTKLQRDIYH